MTDRTTILSDSDRTRAGRPVLLGAVVLAAAAAVAYFALSNRPDGRAQTQPPEATGEPAPTAEGVAAHDTSRGPDTTGERAIEAPGSAERSPSQPPVAIVRSPADKPAASSEGFDPNKAFPGEGPMRVIDIEQLAPQQAGANLPSASERLSMTNSTIERLQAQLDTAEQSGDSARAKRLRVRLARLERQQAAQQRAAQQPTGDEAAPAP